jgi:hypothetical protein
MRQDFLPGHAGATGQRDGADGDSGKEGQAG